MNRFAQWWTAPQPLARVAAFRVLAYLFIPIDVLLTTAWVQWHGDVSTRLYQPLIVGNLLDLPLPTHTVVVSVQWSLIVAAVLAATGRAPRLLGAIVFVLYFEWMIIAMSTGRWTTTGSLTWSCWPCSRRWGWRAGGTAAVRRPLDGRCAASRSR